MTVRPCGIAPDNIEEQPDPNINIEGRYIMLVKLSTDVAECLQHAAACELQAERATDPAAKQSFLDLAARWRRIAGTFEYIARADQFLSPSKR